jgi:NADPH2:quinone reductase
MVGVFWGQFMMREPARARGALTEILTKIRDGKLRPHISARYPLAEAPRALEDIAARRAQGKIVLVP